ITAAARVARYCALYFLLAQNATWRGPAASRVATPSTRRSPSPTTVPPRPPASCARAASTVASLLGGGDLVGRVVLADQVVGQVEGGRAVDQPCLVRLEDVGEALGLGDLAHELLHLAEDLLGRLRLGGAQLLLELGVEAGDADQLLV